MKHELPANWDKDIVAFSTEKAIATRTAGNVILEAIGKNVPELIGGAADLTSSTKTIFKNSPSFHVDPKGKNIYFGVREFGMCAAVNGMAAHGGLIPFGSTFFVFSDYARSAMRMGALMSTHSLFIFTHDSIGLGAADDGLPPRRCERDCGLLEARNRASFGLLHGSQPARPSRARCGKVRRLRRSEEGRLRSRGERQ